MRILGAVLAGGRSTRFGSDKAAALHGGRPLIEHAIDALAKQAEQVVVCGRAWGDRVALTDRPRPDCGPLGGLNAALHFASAGGFDAVLTAPCDVIGLPGDLLALGTPPWHLANAPVIGLWPATLAPILDAHLAASSDRSMRAWARLARSRGVETAQPVLNINTPQDLAEAALHDA